MTCIVVGCDRPATYKAACMCQLHYYRMKTHGSTDKPQRVVVPKARKIAMNLERGLREAVECGECLEWQGKFACKGATPVVAFYDHEKSLTENASVPRLLWEEEHGPVPEGKLVYRTCCNNGCVRREHLACGTRKDWARARRKAGTTKHSATTRLHLTLAARKREGVVNDMEKAREVRQLAAARVPTKRISNQTGVHTTMVAEIRQGRAWRELAASPFAGLVA